MIVWLILVVYLSFRGARDDREDIRIFKEKDEGEEEGKEEKENISSRIATLWMCQILVMKSRLERIFTHPQTDTHLLPIDKPPTGLIIACTTLLIRISIRGRGRDRHNYNLSDNIPRANTPDQQIFLHNLQDDWTQELQFILIAVSESRNTQMRV